MRRGTFRILILFSFAAIVTGASAQEGEFETQTQPKKVILTPQQWAKKLTRNQFLVTRMKATEPAFSGKLLTNHAKGTYACVCCNAPLFSSQTKFTSGTGWPSFWAPYSTRNIVTDMDYSDGQPRVEVECSTCGAHLGHVFSDGPPPTGLRYCINSLSLKFVKATTAKSKSADDKTKSEKDDPSKSDKDTAKPDGGGSDSSGKASEKSASPSAPAEAKEKSKSKSK